MVEYIDYSFTSDFTAYFLTLKIITKEGILIAFEKEEKKS